MGSFFFEKILDFLDKILYYIIVKIKKDLYVVYYTLILDKTFNYKSIIKGSSEAEVKTTLSSKIGREFIVYELKNIRVYLINRNNYKGRKLSDKQIDILEKISYPNGKHKLYKFQKDQWFKSDNRRRNKNGTFKKGFTPWNKDLKLKIIKKNSSGHFCKSRDDSGKFLDGTKPLIVGSKNKIKNEEEAE
tara:strand:+ start:16245 stop:16811 length:567 start_codon:yes stop_codon:yes gene_type:complete